MHASSVLAYTSLMHQHCLAIGLMSLNVTKHNFKRKIHSLVVEILTMHASFVHECTLHAHILLASMPIFSMLHGQKLF